MFGLNTNMMTLVIFAVVIPVILGLVVKSVLWMKDNYIPSGDNKADNNKDEKYNNGFYDFSLKIIDDHLHNPANDCMAGNASYGAFENHDN